MVISHVGVSGVTCANGFDANAYLLALDEILPNDTEFDDPVCSDTSDSSASVACEIIMPKPFGTVVDVLTRAVESGNFTRWIQVGVVRNTFCF